MLNTGIFPDELKIAKVIPLFKKDDPKLLKNYRPISLLPTISKVIEKIIFTQLSTYFNENKLILDNQYGFRPKHSTEYAALELVDRIITDMDKKKFQLTFFSIYLKPLTQLTTPSYYYWKVISIIENNM